MFCLSLFSLHCVLQKHYCIYRTHTLTSRLQTSTQMRRLILARIPHPSHIGVSNPTQRTSTFYPANCSACALLFLQRLAVDARFHRRTIITVTDSRFVCRDELVLLRADAADAACLHHHMVFDMILLNNRLERDSLCYRPTFSLHLPPKRK